MVMKEWVQHCGRLGIQIGDGNLIHLLFADDKVIMTQKKKNLKHVTEEGLKAYNR